MIYEYKCDIHGVFEVQQSVKDPPLEFCPECVKSDKNKIEAHCKKCNSRWKALEINTLADCKNCCFSNLSEIEITFPKPKKLISLSSFILKGGGWANEGYK
jgi:putative FmdB family regulatory protein